MPATWQRRMLKELTRLRRAPPEGIALFPHEENLLEWEYCFEGGAGTPYSGGVYHGTLRFPVEYPHKAPTVNMSTPSGRFVPSHSICINGITAWHQDTWSEATSVEAVAIGVQSFFHDSDNAAGVLRGVKTAEKRWLAAASMAWNRRHVPGFDAKFPDLVAAYEARREREREQGELEGKGGKRISEEVPGAGAKVARTDVVRKPSRSGSDAVLAFFKTLHEAGADDVLALESRECGCPGISGYADGDAAFTYFQELDPAVLTEMFFTVEPAGAVVDSTAVVDLTAASQEDEKREEREDAPHWKLRRVISRGTMLGGVDFIMKELLMRLRRESVDRTSSLSKVLPPMPEADAAAVWKLARIYGVRVREQHGVLKVIASTRGAGVSLTRAQEQERFRFFERELVALETLVDDLVWADPQQLSTG